MVAFDEQGALAGAQEVMLRHHLMDRGITDPAVLKAMREVPRENFLSNDYRHEAYADRPLPIGLGQTISQPYIVALMTRELQLTPQSEVLEIGTGSGYQTAILARIARRVWTIERLNQLTESAQTVLAALGIENVEYCVGDGSKGWPQPRTFDRIIITAAVPEVPQPLADQLKRGGLLVAPVGGPFTQDLIRYEKHRDRLRPSMVCGCRFVKLIGEHAFDED